MSNKIQRLGSFVDNNLKVFSNLDNVRSIPSLIDGFKDSQRKAVYGLSQHGNAEIKVSQLASKIATITHYAHGENSLCETIVGLAQKFTGSNNVNLFEPIGQFGSILSSSAASPRYIYTKPSVNMKKYIRSEDDRILTMRAEGDETYEPEYFLPLAPFWLLNGSVGIGTGHGVKILSRNPKDVLKAIKKMVEGKPVKPDDLMPYFNGWNGIVEKTDSESSWVLKGKFERINSTTMKVTELPVGYGVDKYKTILVDLMEKGVVKDFDSNSDETRFEFVITCPREILKRDDASLTNLFKLSQGFGENITLWNTKGKLQRYENVVEALKEFVEFRIEKYEQRRIAMIDDMNVECSWLEAKSAFIKFWNAEGPRLCKMKKEELSSELTKQNIEEPYHPRLMALQINSLTLDKVDELMKEIDSLTNKIKEFEAKQKEDMYLEELSQL